MPLTTALLALSATAASAASLDAWSAADSLRGLDAAGLSGRFAAMGVEAPAVPEDSLVAKAAPGQAPAAAGFCQASWEERPGTTDYTLFDRSEGSRAPRPDRPARLSLLDNPDHQGRSLCERAKFLRPCFEKVLSRGEESGEFKAWARKAGLDPVRVLQALAAQETKLGASPDTCRRGNCNGIGLMQVITAIGPDGKLLRGDDPRWQGITFNILTNIDYAVRLAAEKLGARGLAGFAYRYNGSPHAAVYSKKVQGYYAQLGACR